MMKVLLQCLAFCFFLPTVTHAWNALGHMVIADIAYQQLTVSARAKVDNMVASLKQEYPETPSFLHLSYWPDALRIQKIETFTHWHYADIAFSLDGTPIKNLLDTDNAVWALKNIEPVVKNAKANAYERARFLAFFVHIVGDLHQPLHTVAAMSVKFPDGDQGGNLYNVRYENEKINLHKLWDGGVGIFSDDATPQHAKEIAANIVASYPRESFNGLADDLNPDHWLAEGMTHAKQSVYNTPENQAVSELYIETGRRTSSSRAALAGYRLGAWLNKILV